LRRSGDTMVKLSFEDLLNKASRGEPDPADSPSEQPKAPPRVSQPDSDSEPDSKPAAVPPARTSTRSRRKPVKLDSDSDSDDPVTITNVRPGANKATPVPIMSPPARFSTSVTCTLPTMTPLQSRHPRSSSLPTMLI